MSLAAGPVSTPSSITVGSPPALGNRSASAAATSAGVIGATRDLAGLLSPLGVRVNAIAPGWMDTRWIDAYVLPELRG